MYVRASGLAVLIVLTKSESLIAAYSTLMHCKTIVASQTDSVVVVVLIVVLGGSVMITSWTWAASIAVVLTATTAFSTVTVERLEASCAAKFIGATVPGCVLVEPVVVSVVWIGIKRRVKVGTNWTVLIRKK